MAIQYYMRAYNTTLSTYVEWIVNDAPDTTGTFSGYPTNQLTQIIVNRVISSKIDNFLKPNHSLGGFDGYYFHVNSYDWLKATAPIGAPTTLTGLAVERGITSITTVSAATNATPIQITTAGAHGLATGSLVTIIGVQGNIAANGTFPITVINGTTFTLNGSQGNGTYTSGGTVYRPTDFATLTWDEGSSLWRFSINTNGDGTTMGASQQVKMLNALIDGYTALGTNPSATGIIRLPNNQFINWRNALNNGDVQGVGVDNLNRIKVGNLTGDLVYMPGSLIVDGYVVHDSNAATTGFIREQNNTNIVAFRHASGGANPDIVALSSNTSNNVILGDSVNGGVNVNTATGNIHSFQVAGTTFLELGNLNGAAPFSTSAFARFSQSAQSPVIGQTAATVGTGQTMTVQAQATSAASQTGGILQLASGRGTGGGGFDGAVDIFTGTPSGGGTRKIRINPTVAPVAADNNSIQIFENRIRFDVAQVLPRLMQDDVTTSSTTGTSLYVQAQNATGATSTGGNLVLSAGTGTTSAGNVIIQTGVTNKIIVTPTLTTILGNLLVSGVTTTVDSTVVEIKDRTINLNSSANQFPGTIVPVPTQITGFAIDRGSPDGTTKRDYYGMFWTEADGYFKLAVNTDGYTTQNALSGTLPLMASMFMAQPKASGTLETDPVDLTRIPTVGGFRALNNTVVVAARKSNFANDLILVSTDSADKLIWGAPTQNTGHIFNTSLSTIYDFQINSVSTYTITPISSGITTHSHASTVTQVIYNQATTGGATGANTTLQAQNAATTGGSLTLTSGTGTTAGDVNIQTGAVSRIIVHPTFTEFRDTAEALRITPVSAGTTQITYASTVTAAQINQTTTGGATGAPMTIQAQNAATTGGSLTLTSGTGVTGGDVNVQTGGVSRVIVHPTFTEFRDNSEALRITPLSAGSTEVRFINTATAARIFQQDLTTNGGTGAPMTVQAQNETGTTSTGGALNLVSGTGTTTNGAINLQVGGTTTASLVTNKFVFNRGRRRNVTTVTGTYAVLLTDDYIAVTTLAAPFTITLPATPVVGDTYEIKDATGNAGTNTLTIDGNGANIDGAATFQMTQPYAAATFTFLNGQWSVT